MTNYHFGQDLLDTYQSMSGLMQFAWLVVPFIFLAVCLMLFLHHLRHRNGETPLPPVEMNTHMFQSDWQEQIVEDANTMMIERRKERLGNDPSTSSG